MKKLIAVGLVCVSLGFAQNRKIIAPGMSSKQVQEIQAAVPNVNFVPFRQKRQTLHIARTVVVDVRHEAFRSLSAQLRAGLSGRRHNKAASEAIAPRQDASQCALHHAFDDAAFFQVV